MTTPWDFYNKFCGQNYEMILRSTKWISMFGYCDPNMQDVARLDKSVFNF